MLNDLVYRAPGMRPALKCAAVSPAAGNGGPPNWLVVSITILPDREPACSIACGKVLHGTEITTTSPKPAACGRAPGRRARADLGRQPLQRLRVPAERQQDLVAGPASCRAIPPPIRPAPMMPTFMSRASNAPRKRRFRGHANTG